MKIILFQDNFLLIFKIFKSFKEISRINIKNFDKYTFKTKFLI